MGDVAEVEEGRLGDVINTWQEREGGVQDDTKVTDLGGGD